jgi:hypothetical protein
MVYDAVEFLESLFQRGAEAGPVCDPSSADLPPDWHFVWDERAAIMEYDGGLPRERAEAEALRYVVEMMRRPGERPGP